VFFRLEYDACITTQTVYHVHSACTRRNFNCVSAYSRYVVGNSDACETCSRRRSRGETCNPTRERTSLEGGPERVQVSQGPRVTLYPRRTPR